MAFWVKETVRSGEDTARRFGDSDGSWLTDDSGEADASVEGDGEGLANLLINF